MHNRLCDVPLASSGIQPGGHVGNEPPVTLMQDLAALGVVPISARWQALRGGRTNALWVVACAKASLVVKLYAPEAATPLFANEPGSEAQVLNALAGSGLAPNCVFHGNTRAGPVLVYDHQSGSPWRRDPAAAAVILRMLHRLPVPSDLQCLNRAPDGFQALKDQTRAILAQIPAHERLALLSIEPDITVPPNDYKRLLHGDPVPDNIVWRGDAGARSLTRIDWQCPALGDPILDLALFLSPAMQIVTRGAPLSETERQQFLTAYEDAQAVSRLTAMQPVFHWRMAAYCLWKLTRTTPDQSYKAAMEAEISALGRIAA